MANSRMLPITPDCFALIENVGNKLRSVLPRYAKYVLGDENSKNFPNPFRLREMLNVFLPVHARFNGRDFNTAQFLEKGPDLRATEHEMAIIGELCGYLIALDAEANTKQTGEKSPVLPFTLDLNNMFLLDRIVG